MSDRIQISESIFCRDFNNELELKESDLRFSQSLQMLYSEATSGYAAVGMSFASLAGIFCRTKTLSVCGRWLGESVLARNFSHYFSIGTGLGAEGFGFHLFPEFLKKGNVSTVNMLGGGASSTLTLGFSRIAMRGPQGLLVQQFCQDFALISAQEVSECVGWTEKGPASLGERWVSARIMAYQMHASAGLVRITCHEIQLTESKLRVDHETNQVNMLSQKVSTVGAWAESLQTKMQELFLPQSANEANSRMAVERANEQTNERTKRSQLLMMNGEEGKREVGLTSFGERVTSTVESSPETIFEFDPTVEYHTPLQTAQIVPRRIADPRKALLVLPMGGIGPYGHERSTYLRAIGDPQWIAEVGVINGHLKRIDIGRYADAISGEELTVPQVVERYGREIEEKSGVQTLDSRAMRIVRDDLYMNPLTGETGSYPPDRLKEIATNKDLFVSVPYGYGVYRHPITGEELSISTESIRQAKDSIAGSDKSKKELFKMGDRELLLLTDLPFEYLPTNERVTRAKAEALLDAEFSNDADFEALAKLALETDWAGQIPPGLRGPEGETAKHLLGLLGISRKDIPKFSFQASSTYLTNADPVAVLALYSLIRSARQYGFYLSEIGPEIGIHVSSGIGGWQSVIEGTTAALRRKRGGKRIATVPPTETNNIAMLLNDFIQGYLGTVLGMKGEDASPIRDNSIDVGACATGHKNFRRAADSVRSGNTRIGFFGGTEFVLGLPWCRPAITSFNAIMAMATRAKLKGVDPHRAPKNWYAPLYTEAGFQIAEGAGLGAMMSVYDGMEIAPAEAYLVGGYAIRGDQGGKKNSAEMGIGAIHARQASLMMMAEQLGFPPEIIQGIFLHGTGTQTLNIVELEQAAQTYTQQVWISALKGLIGGHLLGAAPALEDAVILQALAYGSAPGVYIPSDRKLTDTAQRLVDGGRILVSPGPHTNPQHVESVKNGFGGNNTNVNYHLMTDEILAEQFGYTPREIAAMRARQRERKDIANYWERAMDVTGQETGATFLNQFGLKERAPVLPTFIDLGAVSSKDVEGKKPAILLSLAARQRGQKIRYKNISPELADVYEFVETGVDFRHEVGYPFEAELANKVTNLKEAEREKLASYLGGAFHLSNPQSREVIVRALGIIIPQISSKGTRWDFTKLIVDQLVDRNFVLRTTAEKTLVQLASTIEQVDAASLAWKAVHVMKNGFSEVQENSSRVVQSLIPLVYLHERNGLAIELVRWHAENRNNAEAEAVLETTRPHLIDREGIPRNLEDFDQFAKRVIEKSSQKNSYFSTLEEDFKNLLTDPEQVLDNLLRDARRRGFQAPIGQEVKTLESVSKMLETQILPCCEEGTHEQRLELAYKMQAVIDSPITTSVNPYLRGTSSFKYVAYTFTKLLLPRILPTARFSVAVSLGRWLLDQRYGNLRGFQYKIEEAEMQKELEEITTYLGSGEEREEFNRQIKTMVTMSNEREEKATRVLHKTSERT